MKCKWLILIVLLGLFSCGESPQQPVVVTKDAMKNSMEKANRYLSNAEEEEIENYVRRHGWDMVSTGTGLRYQIVKQGSEDLIEKGQKVLLEYQLQSIQGDMIYSSEKDGIKAFIVGEGTVESGLDEALTHLHYGDVARIIIPSHLGYGLHGDDNEIQQYETLVYTIKIIENQ